MLLRRILSSALGILLLPAAAALARTVYRLLVAAQLDPAAEATLARIAAGAGIWLALFLLLTRPIRTYVLAHELSHALAAWLSGKRVSRIRVSRSGGSVEVSETNLFITLAPYMIPFYSLLLLATTGLLSLRWDLSPFLPWLPLLLGASWSFHLTFTLLSLSLGQSDIRLYGPLLAYPVILIGNLLCLMPLLAWLASLPLEDSLRIAAHDLLHAYTSTARFAKNLL